MLVWVEGGMGTSIHTRSHMVMRGSFPLASPFVPTSGKALSRVLDSLSSFSHLALDLSPSVLPPTYDMILQFHFDGFQSLSILPFLLYFSYPSPVYASFWRVELQLHD